MCYQSITYVLLSTLQDPCSIWFCISPAHAAVPHAALDELGLTWSFWICSMVQVQPSRTRFLVHLLLSINMGWNERAGWGMEEHLLCKRNDNFRRHLTTSDLLNDSRNVLWNCGDGHCWRMLKIKPHVNVSTPFDVGFTPWINNSFENNSLDGDNSMSKELSPEGAMAPRLKDFSGVELEQGEWVQIEKFINPTWGK